MHTTGTTVASQTGTVMGIPSRGSPKVANWCTSLYLRSHRLDRASYDRPNSRSADMLNRAHSYYFSSTRTLYTVLGCNKSATSDQPHGSVRIGCLRHIGSCRQSRLIGRPAGRESRWGHVCRGSRWRFLWQSHCFLLSRARMMYTWQSHQNYPAIILTCVCLSTFRSSLGHWSGSRLRRGPLDRLFANRWCCEERGREPCFWHRFRLTSVLARLLTFLII